MKYLIFHLISQKIVSQLFLEYLISRFLRIFRECLGILEFARVKFHDFSQIAKVAKFNNRKIKWEINKVLQK